jgi:hypothetical protein
MLLNVTYETTHVELAHKIKQDNYILYYLLFWDRLYGLVVRVLGYRSGGLGSILSTTRKKSNGSGTGSTLPREYN